MKILVLAQLNSPHTIRWCDWLMEHNIDVFPISITDPEQIKRQIELYKPDILHAFFLPIWGYAAYKTGFHPLVVTAIGSDLLQYQNYQWDFIHNPLAAADAFVGLSRELTHLGVEYGADQLKARTIHLGVDTLLFKKGYSPLRNKWRKDPKTKIILSVRHMSELYNHDTIFRALWLISKERSDVEIMHVDPNGDPDYFQKMADLIDELGITNKVNSHEALPHYRMPQAYNAADVVIGIPKTDGLPVSMLEAMACEVPYIATDTETNRAFLPREWLVNPKSAGEVAKALMDALDKPYDMKELRQKVTDGYEQDIIMHKALEMYWSLL